MKKFLSLIIVFVYLGFSAFGQDTLPKFDLKNIGNRHIIISWRNNFDVVKQISIQRSPDSLKNFKTILTVADPTAKENGYADSKAPADNLYYRLFIVLDKGGFVFTDTKRPRLDSLIVQVPVRKPDLIPETVAPVEEDSGRSLKQDHSKTEKLDFNNKNPRPGTNHEISGNKPVLNVYVPSVHVYTYKDGTIRISLPDTGANKYSIKFFEEDNSFVFEIKDLKQTPVSLDKANFYHAGWFKFELYEDGKLIEKNKFRIAKDF